MRFSSLCIIVMAGLAVGACSDVTAPVDVAPSFAKKNKTSFFDSYFGSGISIESATIPEGDALTLPTGIDASDAPANTLEQAPDAPLLETYSTSFTHTQGETTVFFLRYQEQDGFASPFIVVEIPPDAQVLDHRGKPVRKGKSVEITVEVDLVKFLVHFGPHGSTFLESRPATLWFYYDNADQSGEDKHGLTVWYQASIGEAWSALETEVSTFDGWARVPIYHFSNYAIAW